MIPTMQAIDIDLKKAYLRNQACFTQLTDNEIEMLANLLVEKEFSKGETIVNEGDLVDSVYLIVSGVADVQHIRVVNNQLESESVTTLKVGDAIGLNETGFYSLSGKRTATVVALTEMTVLYLSVAAFHGFSLANSHVNAMMRKQASKFTR